MNGRRTPERPPCKWDLNIWREQISPPPGLEELNLGTHTARELSFGHRSAAVLAGAPETRAQRQAKRPHQATHQKPVEELNAFRFASCQVQNGRLAQGVQGRRLRRLQNPSFGHCLAVVPGIFELRGHITKLPQYVHLPETPFLSL